jgi:hypothetical protein
MPIAAVVGSAGHRHATCADRERSPARCNSSRALGQVQTVMSQFGKEGREATHRFRNRDDRPPSSLWQIDAREISASALDLAGKPRVRIPARSPGGTPRHQRSSGPHQEVLAACIMVAADLKAVAPERSHGHPASCCTVRLRLCWKTRVSRILKD